MDASTYVALAALAVASLGQVGSFGRREGKVDAVLAELKEITKDHETRLRNGGH